MSTQTNRLGSQPVGPPLAAGPSRGEFDNQDGTPASAGPTRPSRLWLWVIAVISLQLLAWTAWFILASRHPVAEVPLVTSGKQ